MSYRKFHIFAIAGAASLAAVSPAFAAPIELFTENFESATVDSPFPSPWALTHTTDPMQTPKSTVLVKEDTTGTLFGTAGNKYGELIDPRDGGPAARADRAFGPLDTSISNNAFLTVSFDFYEPSGVGPATTLPTLPHSFNVQVGTDANGQSTRGIDFRLSNGKLYHTLSNGSLDLSTTKAEDEIDYSLDQAHHIDIVANFSPAALGISDYGLDTVANGRYDVWLDGVLVGDNLPFRNSSERGKLIDSIRFGTDNISLQNFFIDNIAVYNGVSVVPEPNAILIFAIGSLLLFPCRKFRFR